MFGFFLAYDAGWNAAVGFGFGVLAVAAALVILLVAASIVTPSLPPTVSAAVERDRQGGSGPLGEGLDVQVFRSGDGFDVVVHLDAAEAKRFYPGTGG